MSDLKYAFRTLIKAPGLSLVIIFSLAISIGVNTTIFSWLNGMGGRRHVLTLDCG